MSENSPYTPPSAAVADAAVDFGEISIFSLSGRLGRIRYLTYGIAIAFIAQLLLVLMGGTGAMMQNETASTLSMIGIGVVYIAMVVIIVMLAVQRLHDLDKTGWLYLLILVPILNIIFAFYMLLAPGSAGANRFGNPPPANSTGVVIVGWIMIVMFVVAIIGIIAAIAI
ncbi:MAG: DUF805 domain-containing protein, partial [Halobacteria archaeon]|nr:DUF805 domain-containing protein [Halobacteria archaeon]